MNKSFLFLLFGFIVGALLFTIGCTSSSSNYQSTHLTGVIWGTTYNITYNPGSSRLSTVDATSLVDMAIDKIDSVANAFNPQSEIARLNEWGRLECPSETFLTLLNYSGQIYEKTGGAFDPTVGPLVNMWGFGAERPIPNPNTAQVDSVLALVGFEKVIFNTDSISFSSGGMRLDLAAIAKGAGVDAVADAFQANGVEDYMIEIGGEVRVHGDNPQGRPWTIQIDAPVADTTVTHRRLCIIELNDAAVATSGNYRNFIRDASGRLLYHTVSPTTGQPVQNDILSATVIAKSTMVADAFATACMVLGLQSAVKLIEELRTVENLEIYGAIFVTPKEDSFIIHPVGLVPEHVIIREN